MSRQYFTPFVYRQFSASKFSSPLSQSSNNFLVLHDDCNQCDPHLKLKEGSQKVELSPGKTLLELEKELIATG
jgi:hypothetical protein